MGKKGKINQVLEDDFSETSGACNLCNKWSPSYLAMLAHQKDVHKECKVFCKEHRCKRRFRTVIEMLAHWKRHDGGYNGGGSNANAIAGGP